MTAILKLTTVVLVFLLNVHGFDSKNAGSTVAQKNEGSIIIQEIQKLGKKIGEIDLKLKAQKEIFKVQLEKQSTQIAGLTNEIRELQILHSDISSFVGTWDVCDPTFESWIFRKDGSRTILNYAGEDYPVKESDEDVIFPKSKGWYKATRTDGYKSYYYRQVYDRLSSMYFHFWSSKKYHGKKGYAFQVVGKPTFKYNGSIIGKWDVEWRNEGENYNKYVISKDGTLKIDKPAPKSFQIGYSGNSKYSVHNGWYKAYNKDKTDETMLYLRVLDNSTGIMEVKMFPANGQPYERFGWK